MRALVASAARGPRTPTLLVSELVTNAVKYGPEDGEIRLIIDQDDDAHALHRA